MENYNIYEIAADEYVSLPVTEDDGCLGTPDGTVSIDTRGAWIPGSQQDLRAYLSELAIEKYCS